MMEIARNPSRLQEMTRTMDRQMQNLEAMPGKVTNKASLFCQVISPYKLITSCLAPILSASTVFQVA